MRERRFRGVAAEMAVLVSAVFFSCSTQAMTVWVKGTPVPFQATEDGVWRNLELTDFVVLGLPDGVNVAILTGGSICQVDRAQFDAAVPGLDLSSFPTGNGLSGLGNGSYGAGVLELEQSLKDLGYFEGNPDETFDGETVSAVTSFQSFYGLPATGYAGVNTQLLILQAPTGLLSQSAEVVYPPDGSAPVISGGSSFGLGEVNATVESKFADIKDSVREDLTPFLGGEWRYSYDVYEGMGTLSSSLTLGQTSVAEPPVDAIQLKASLEVLLERNLMGDGKIGLLPVLTISSTGAYRPYVTMVTLVSGNETCELVGAMSSGEVKGISLLETDYLTLTQEAQRFMAEHSSFEMRIAGMNNYYDMSVQADGISAFFDTVGRYIQ